MSTFPLRIGTPDGLLYEGEVSRLVCRTISGDLAILPRHCNYCTALGMGEAHIVLEDGSRKTAACIGGMLSVMNGTCRVLATTWEWKEDIDALKFVFRSDQHIHLLGADDRGEFHDHVIILLVFDQIHGIIHGIFMILIRISGIRFKILCKRLSVP